MSHGEFSQFIQDLLYANEQNLLNDPFGRAMRRIIDAGVQDRLVTDELRNRVHRHQVRRAFEGFFKTPRLHTGQMILGKDGFGRFIRCPVEYFNEHSVMIAATGSAKTTLSRFWALQLVPHVRGVWLFDLRKREWGRLAPYLAAMGVDLLVISARQLRLNPLQVPERVHPQEFAPNLADALVRVFQLPPMATKLLHLAILALYQRFGIFAGGKCYPTLFDLYQAVEATTNAHPQARQAVLASLAPVLVSLKDVLAWQYGWTTHELAQRRLVIQFDGISETDKNLLLNTLLIGEFTSRVAQGISNPRAVSLLVFCDEAQRLAGSSDTSISEWIGLVRGTGIGLHLSMQSAQVAPGIMANVPHRFLGRSTSAADIAAVGATMGLTAEQRRWLTTNLERGQFLGCLGQGWRKPFLFWAPNLRFESPPGGAGQAGAPTVDQLLGQQISPH